MVWLLGTGWCRGSVQNNKRRIQTGNDTHWLVYEIATCVYMYICTIIKACFGDFLTEY